MSTTVNHTHVSHKNPNRHIRISVSKSGNYLSASAMEGDATFKDGVLFSFAWTAFDDYSTIIRSTARNTKKARNELLKQMQERLIADGYFAKDEIVYLE